jgi:hypothetical protein
LVLLEHLSWEDETRLTFIELANYMDKNSNPLDFLIDFAWANGADRFVVNNAKDEIKKLRQEANQIKEKTKEWVSEVYRANEFATEQMNLYLEKVEEIERLKETKRCGD